MPLEDSYEPCIETNACAVADPEIDHVLIIDDETAQSEVVKHVFSRQGYRVSTCATSQDGLAAAHSERPDLILLDIRLPDSDGLETCSCLCDGPETAGIPVIIISGVDDSDVLQRARAAGCHYYVRKPYDPSALLVLAKSAIAESRDW